MDKNEPSPAEQAQGKAVQQGDGELPPLPETNYNGCGDGSEPLYTPEMMQDYASAALAQRAGSAKPPEQAEAQGKPATTEGCAGFQGKPVADCGPCAGQGCDGPAVTVDTPEFKQLLRHYINVKRSSSNRNYPEYLTALITHIDAHVSRAVAEALAPLKRENLELKRVYEERGNQIQRLDVALERAIQPSQPAGAVQEPVAYMMRDNRLSAPPKPDCTAPDMGWSTWYPTTKEHGESVLYNKKKFPENYWNQEVLALYTAPPAAVQPFLPMLNALIADPSESNKQVVLRAMSNLAHLASSSKQSDSERDAALGKVLAEGYEGGTMMDEDLGGTVRLHYKSVADAENVFDAISNAIDATITAQQHQGEKGGDHG